MLNRTSLRISSLAA
jgi:CHAT domain-containing protein